MSYKLLFLLVESRRVSLSKYTEVSKASKEIVLLFKMTKMTLGHTFKFGIFFLRHAHITRVFG